MAANVAQGTIYYYFDSRDDLFAHLLPEVGKMMIKFIAAYVPSDASIYAKEAGRIRGYLEFLRTHPSFYRVLQEAEVFAPEAHSEHMNNMVSGYIRALKQDVAREGVVVEDKVLETTVYMLLGARNYLAMRFVEKGVTDDAELELLVEVYLRLLRGGLLNLEAGADDIETALLRQKTAVDH